MTEGAEGGCDARRTRLEELVELEMQTAHVDARLPKLLTDPAERARAEMLLRDLRDLLERASAAAEAELKTYQAEQGINPDD